MIWQQFVYNLIYRGVFGQEKHKITAELKRFLYNLVEIRIDMIKTVLLQELIASSTPRWTQKDAVDILVTVFRDFKLRNLLIIL